MWERVRKSFNDSERLQTGYPLPAISGQWPTHLSHSVSPLHSRTNMFRRRPGASYNMYDSMKSEPQSSVCERVSCWPNTVRQTFDNAPHRTAQPPPLTFRASQPPIRPDQQLSTESNSTEPARTSWKNFADDVVYANVTECECLCPVLCECVAPGRVLCKPRLVHSLHIVCVWADI